MTSSHASVPIATLLAHREWVRRLARSLVRDEASADDVEQRTWLTALRSPPRDADSARAWLARVVRNQALDSFRATGRRDAHERAAARGGAVRSSADVVAEAESQKLVVVAVCGLAEPYRTTMLLRFFEDLPPREVAARMGVPVETVRTRLRRGAELVRAELGGDRSAWLAALTPLAAAPRGGAAIRIAGGAVMKTSTKAALVAVLLLGAAGAVTFLLVGNARDGGATGDTASVPPPAAPSRAAADPDAARSARRPRTRAAADATTAAASDPATTPPTSVPSAEEAHAARAVTVTSPPRPSGRAAPLPAPWSADELLDLLAKPASPALPCNELADDAVAFARGFALRRVGETIDPLRADPAAPLADGTRIVFPAGCHRWDTTALYRDNGKGFPQDLVVEGAGMDETLVVPKYHLVAGGKIGVITFRNLTIHCNDYCLIGVTINVVHFDHVRVIGFDGIGPNNGNRGTGEFVSGQAFAFLAEDCRFETGFGTAPGRVNWLLGTSAWGTEHSGWLTIARFERCKFLGPFEKPQLSVFFTSPPAATVYSQCDLIDCAPADRAAVEHPEQTPSGWAPTYLRFEDCRVSYAPASDGTPRRRRDVSELNPAWTMPAMGAPK